MRATWAPNIFAGDRSVPSTLPWPAGLASPPFPSGMEITQRRGLPDVGVPPSLKRLSHLFLRHLQGMQGRCTSGTGRASPADCRVRQPPTSPPSVPSLSAEIGGMAFSAPQILIRSLPLFMQRQRFLGHRMASGEGDHLGADCLAILPPEPPIDQVGHRLHLLSCEPPGGNGGGADTDPRGDPRFL